MSFFEELKRRNVFKVAFAYFIVSWLLLQVSDTLVPALHLPEWFNSGVAFVLIIGFPIAMVFAWAFEMTPEGLQKEKDVDRSQSITQHTGRTLDFAIIAVLVLALGYFAYDKFGAEDKSGSELKPATETLEGSDKTEQVLTLTPGENSIAVLPFVNMSEDAGNEYFSDGLSEELLNLLAKIPELRVAARTSSFSFKGQSVEITEIAKRLKVNHVLEGSVRKSGNQVRITAQLIKAVDGYHLWSETYDRQLDNIFQIQDEIALAVVEALKVTLLGAAPRARETDPRAYQLYLEGQYFSRQGSVNSIDKSIGLFKQALAIDPIYAPAWTSLANSYIWSAGLGSTPIEESNDLADRAIERALAIDPTSAPAFLVRGLSRVFNKFTFSAGMEDWQHALQMDPNSADALGAVGLGHESFGRFKQAIDFHLAAIELDPVQPALHETLGTIYYYSNDLFNAAASFRKLLSLSPDYTGAHYRLGRVLLKQGNAAAALQEMEQEDPNVYLSTGLAMAQYTIGNIEASDQALAELIADAAEHAAFQIAEVYGFRNEADKAFEWLSRAYEIHDSGIASTLGNPAFESLLNDPRWVQFLDRLGLAEAWRKMPPEHGGPAQ